MKMIVAVDRQWGIGYKGDLLARVRADLMNFKKHSKLNVFFEYNQSNEKIIFFLF